MTERAHECILSEDLLIDKALQSVKRDIDSGILKKPPCNVSYQVRQMSVISSPIKEFAITTDMVQVRIAKI